MRQSLLEAGDRRTFVVVVTLALALPALAGCVSSSEPLPAAGEPAPTKSGGAQASAAAPAEPLRPAEAPATLTPPTASPRGPFLADFPAGADTVLFALPLPEEARIEDEDTGETSAALALDPRAFDGTGAPLATERLLVHVALWTRAGATLGSAVLLPEGELVVEGEPGWSLVQGASVSFALPDEDLGEVLVAAIVRGSGVARAAVAVAWLDAIPDVGEPLAPDAARKAVATLGTPASAAVLESGSGGHFAAALDAPGGSFHFGVEHERSALVAEAGLEADARIATSYEFEQGHARGGYQADAAVALFYTGPLDWKYTYQGAVEGTGGSTDVNTGQILLDLVVYGLQGYFGLGAVEPGTTVAASYEEHLVAGRRFVFVEVHAAFPVPLAPHMEVAPYALIDCSGPGAVLNNCEPLLAAGALPVVREVLRQGMPA